MVPSDSSRVGLTPLLLALAVSEFGDKLVQVVYAIVALDRGSTAVLAGVLAAQTVPIIVLTPVIAARGWGRSRSAWRGSLLGQSAAFLVAATFADRLAVVIACVAVAAALESVSMPLSRTLLHLLSAGRHAELTRWWGIAKAAAGAAGMAVAGLVVARFGPEAAFAVNAVTFAVVAVVAWSPPVVPADVDDARRRATAGLRALRNPQAFGALGLVVVVVMLVATSLEGVAGPFMLQRTPGFDVTGLGLVMACWAVASLLTAALTPVAAQGNRALLGVAVVLVGVALGIPSLGAPFWVAAVAFGVGGIGNGLFNLLLSRMIWSGVPALRQADAWGAFNVVLNVTVVAGFVVGLGIRPSAAPVLLAAVSALALTCGAAYAMAQRRSPPLGAGASDPA